MKVKFLYSLLLCLLPLLTWAEDPVVTGATERKKTIIKLFDVDSKDNLVIDNQFGEVTIGLWDKSEIRVQIVISANSESDERVQKYLDAVSIEEKRTGNQILLRTNFSQSSVSNWSMGNWKNNGERNFVKINYEVIRNDEKLSGQIVIPFIIGIFLLLFCLAFWSVDNVIF